MGRSGTKGGNGGGACGKGKDKSGSFVSCSQCRYRWNFKTNHWCYQCCSPLVPNPSVDKKPAGQWSFGPPVLAAAAEGSAVEAATAPAAGKKGPPVPPRGAKGASFDRRPWVWHGGGWHSNGGGQPAAEQQEAPAADPLELLRAEFGDSVEFAALVAKRAEAKAQQPQAEAPPRRAPLLEEEVSTKGVACRRAQAWLETCATRVLEGELWLDAAKAEEDTAMSSAYQAQIDWEAACKRQLPSAPLEGEEVQAKAPAASAINLSTLVDEGKLQIIDGPLFDMGDLEIDGSDKEEWNRIKAELADSVQAKVQEALGPAAEHIVKLREEAKKLHARMQAKRRRGADGGATATGGADTVAGGGAASPGGSAAAADGTGVAVRDLSGPEALRAAARAKAATLAADKAKAAAEAAEVQRL